MGPADGSFPSSKGRHEQVHLPHNSPIDVEFLHLKQLVRCAAADNSNTCMPAANRKGMARDKGVKRRAPHRAAPTSIAAGTRGAISTPCTGAVMAWAAHLLLAHIHMHHQPRGRPCIPIGCCYWGLLPNRRASAVLQRRCPSAAALQVKCARPAIRLYTVCI